MIRSFACIPLVVVAASVAFSQEIYDQVVRQRTELTIFDEIADRAERDAFRELWDTKPARTRLARADAFVDRYPASGVLREAYELGARACAELGDNAGALHRARLSLRLLPENPFLLVMTADLAAKQSDLSQAERDARDALRLLANADTPSPVTPADWPQRRDHLRATAYFVLGRVAATRNHHAEARRLLLTALALNPTEIDALYTLAVVQMALGDERAAAASFAEVMRTPGPLAGVARTSLMALHARKEPGTDFETYAAALRWEPPKEPPRAPSRAAGAYAGSVACRECHTAIYERWQSTGMARMFRPYRAADVMGDFSEHHIVSDLARPVVQDGRHFIDIRASRNAPWIRYPVDYLIGSKWQQAYATRLPDSRILVFPIQYSRSRSTWVNYWGLVDGPGSERKDISRFQNIPEGAVYQTSCAACHTSQLQFTGGVQHPATGVFREEGINCEMCHGPSQEHIERIRLGDTSSPNADLPLRFRRLPADQSVAVCAQCHAQSAIHDADAAGHVNYSVQLPFVRTYPTQLPSGFSRTAFFRDGRHRATTFIVEAFERSQCFRAGNATCASCHDPHSPDAAANPTSLKFRSDLDRMCVQCHGALAQDPEKHTRHLRGSEASRCVSCHMPKIMDALLFPARTHEIDDIPDAEMTARFGNDESPNACLMCHKDRDVNWLREALRQF